MAAIVDVYDAITSDRVYHKGMEPTAALEKVIEWSRFRFKEELARKFVQTVGIYPRRVVRPARGTACWGSSLRRDPGPSLSRSSGRSTA